MIDTFDFTVGSVKISAEIDPGEVYYREDLSPPGFFSCWDLPGSFITNGRRYSLIFRRMPNLGWKLAKEGDYETLALEISKHSLMDKLDPGLYQSRALSKISEICERRIKSMVAEQGLHEEGVVSSFHNSSGKLKETFTVKQEPLVFSLYESAEPEGALMVISSTDTRAPGVVSFDAYSSLIDAQEAYVDVLSAKAYEFKRLINAISQKVFIHE